MDIKLPKKCISYSQCDLWTTSKKEYRLRYYEGKGFQGNKFVWFGSEVHDRIDKDDEFADIRLPVAEKKMMVNVDSIPVLGYIDTLDEDTYYFGDYKTSMSPWTQRKVDKHKQFEFYSLLLAEKYAIKNPNKAYLVWLETEKWDNKETIDGVTFYRGEELRLTGRRERFEREITQEQRDEMKQWIKQCALEISKDYETWTENKS